MRFEVYVCLCTLLGMAALDLSANVEGALGVHASDDAVTVAHRYFLSNVGAYSPQGLGVVALVVNPLVALAAVTFVYRLATQREAVDVAALVGVCFGLRVFVRDVLGVEHTLPSHAPLSPELRALLARLYTCHLTLAFVVLFLVLLSTFAERRADATRHAPAQQLLFVALALANGINLLNTSFEAPLLLAARGASTLSASAASSLSTERLFALGVELAAHQDTWLHLTLVPALFAVLFVAMIARAVSPGTAYARTLLLLNVAVAPMFFLFVEPAERRIAAAFDAAGGFARLAASNDAAQRGVLLPLADDMLAVSYAHTLMLVLTWLGLLLNYLDVPSTRVATVAAATADKKRK